MKRAKVVGGGHQLLLPVAVLGLMRCKEHAVGTGRRRPSRTSVMARGASILEEARWVATMSTLTSLFVVSGRGWLGDGGRAVCVVIPAERYSLT